MTKAQNIKLLIGLGFPKELAEKMSAQIPDTATATDETELEEGLTSCIGHQRELYTSSDEYKTALKKIKDGALAEIHSKAEKKIIAIAQLSADEVKDKKYDEIVELAFKKASASGNKSLEEVQAELRKVSDKVKEYEETTIPSIKAEVEQEKVNFKTEASLMKKIGSLKLREGMSVEDIVELTKLKANKAGYKVSFDEKGEMVFTAADGGKIMTADKKGFLSTDEVLNTFLEGMIEKSNADKKDKTPVVVNAGKDKDKPEVNQGVTVSAATAKAQAHAKALLEDED